MNNKGFQLGIRQVLKDDKRNLTIISKEYRKDKNGWNQKYYKYRCNICGYEGWMKEGSLIGKQNHGCSCCSNKTIVLGINTIWDTDKWMCDLGVSEEDAKTHTHGSNDKVEIICPDCGKISYKTINSIYTYKSICCSCNDSTSYGEKCLESILKQSSITYQTQLNKTTFEWCNKYRYDFYFEYNNEKYICEVNGIQHYEESPRGRSLKEEKENDKLKKKLALSNGIKPENYIVIDCRKSDLEFIKQNIINSRLNELFDLNSIDWLKVEKFALSNLVKRCCDLWNSKKYTTKEIAEIMKRAIKTIRKWLNKGNEIGLCIYNGKKEMIKPLKKYNQNKTKEIKIFKDNIFLGVFESACELSRQSEKLFGTKFDNSSISKVCKGKLKIYKGFEFQYVE